MKFFQNILIRFQDRKQLGDVGYRTPDLIHAKHALYHWATSPSAQKQDFKLKRDSWSLNSKICLTNYFLSMVAKGEGNCCMATPPPDAQEEGGGQKKCKCSCAYEILDPLPQIFFFSHHWYQQFQHWIYLGLKMNLYSCGEISWLKKCLSQSAGFEPALPKGIWFRVRRLNHSATIALYYSLKIYLIDNNT